jgi:hypothetical protein
MVRILNNISLNDSLLIEKAEDIGWGGVSIGDTNETGRQAPFFVR